MKSELDYVIFATLFLLTKDVSGLITEDPLNAATDVGQQAVFSCTSDTTQQNWIFSAKRDDLGTPSAKNIVLSCVVQSGFTTQYDVDRPGGSSNKCNLIVKATTVQQAGVYTCSDSTTGPSAILTVIDRDPSITVFNSSGVVAGDKVTMSYTVRYYTSTASSQTPTIQPVLTWRDSDGNIISSSNTPGTNSITSSISITAERQAIQPYTCSISYQINGSTTMFASNTPNSVSAPPPTITIDVLYAPVMQSIKKGENVPICPGDTVTITCDATANPPATYSWIGPDSRNYNGSTIVADMNGVYTCTASNKIQGTTHSDTINTTLAVLCWFWLLLLLWLLNPIAAAIFLIHYKYSKVRNDYNERYLFLNKMLPCVNNSQETPGKKAGWITLFIVMTIFSGIQFLILTIVTYSGCKKGENGRVNGCGSNPGTTQRKYARKSVDETAVQKSAQNTKQTNQKKVHEAKSDQRKTLKSIDQKQTTNDTSEEQSNAPHAKGTRFQNMCFALALGCMILGMILFAISVGVIYYECNRQCNKR